MNYTLNLNNSDDHVVIVDEHMVVANGSVLPLTLYGPHILFDYGEQFQNNFYYLLENYASSPHINTPVPGMLWLDNTNNIPTLKLYTDAYAWKRILFDYQNILSINLSNNLPEFNSFALGQTIEVIITSDPGAVLVPANIKWYLYDTLILSGTTSIVTDTEGDYFATYTYKNSDGKSMVAQTPIHRVIEFTETNSTTTGYVEIHYDVDVGILTASLIYADITPFSIEWEWSIDDTPVGSGVSSGINSIYTIQQPGVYRITAKYNDTYHTDADKVTVGGYMNIY